MGLSNSEIARKLKEVAAAYTIKKANPFQIRAYETAADVVEHSTSEIKDLWEESQLDQVPGLGESLKAHLDELFTTGQVKHWTEVKKGIPDIVFKLLDIPGIGPQTALKVAKTGVKGIDDLRQWVKSGRFLKQGLSERLVKKISSGLEQLQSVKTGRILLPYAYNQAETVLDYLKQNKAVKQADVLGSLRRMVATVGDLDFAIASDDPGKVVEYIVKFPGSKVIEKGETQVSLLLSSGLRLDFLIVEPSSYGALLQHFTGSKSHNIHLRSLAATKGLSLSEYGIKNVKTGKLRPSPTEKEFYSLLDMDVPPPELREDSGEIEASLKHQLPDLVELKDIKGDLHIHSNLISQPSHDPGVNSLQELVGAAKKLNYKYMGISDHQPSQVQHTQEQMVKTLKKRRVEIEKINYSQKSVRVLNLLEVDIFPDGTLGVADDGLKELDFAIASIHSSFQQSKEKMTHRILKALSSPYIKILGHPTGRLLNKRESYEVDWEEVFKFAAKNNKALEINAYPDRLDLPDNLVRRALSFGVKFVINTDTHQVNSLDNMKFGVAVARRGWATKKDIINAWDWTRFSQWFSIS